MNYISLDNLTRYHSKFKDYADAKYTLARDYGWKQTEKAGAVTCWPVGESRMKPVVEFMFKETLPEGTKGPSNPSVIEGVENIKIIESGKNLLPFPYSHGTRTTNGVTFTVNDDGSVLANGTSTARTVFFLNATPQRIIFHPGISYTMHGRATNVNGNNVAIGVDLFSFEENPVYKRTVSLGNDSSVSFTVDTKMYGRQYIAIANRVTVQNELFYFQIEISTTKTSYEKPIYNSYITPLNDTFYGGTLDVASGRLTVTHRMVEADSLTLDISNYPAYLPLECTDTFGRTITSTGNILALTGSTGGKIVYKLANPYTVQIDPVAITALPQVDKYTPRINTLYTDAENITVGYIKSPIRDEYEKVQAIIANGGTV